MSTNTFRALGALLLVPTGLTAQRPTLSAAVKQYVAVDTPVVALTHVRVIDGTGAAPKEDQTLIIRDGNIIALGAARSTRVPEGAQMLDLTGKSVIPGLVMMHEHLYYPTGPGVYGADYVSFSRLYLAGGVTSMRTGRNVGESGGTLDRRHRALRERSFPVHADVRPEGLGRRAPLRGILGGRGRDVVQSIHEHHPRRARRGGG